MERNYSRKKCLLCHGDFKSDHPRRLRCYGCSDEKCSSCGRKIKAGLKRLKSKPRKCARCWPLPIGSKRYDSLGYLMIKTKRGWHLEHRVIAEKTIGRRLQPGEVVHHKDGNPSNNASGNLVVCRSLRDHLDRFHKADLKNPPTHHNGRRKKGSPGWKPIMKV